MSELFRLITPICYWILILLWSFILYFYIKKLWGSKTRKLFQALVLILAIDAFRTLFESTYFGLWYTSLSGIIPVQIGTFLTRPELVIIPKILNIVAAIIIIVLLLKRWLPQEEAELLRYEQDLRESQKIAKLGSWRLDLATNKVTWTEELYKMYGFDPTLPPPSYNEHMKLFTPESWKLLSASVTNTIESGIPYELELEMMHKNGQKGWIWLRGETVTDDDGKTVELWGAAQDITQRKRSEEEKEILENQLRHSQKVEAIGTLAGGIAHDFNNILSVILGYAEMAKEDSAPESLIKEDLAMIIDAGNRAKDLVRQILAFSRQDDIERIHIQPAPIVTEAIAMLRPSLPSTIEITQNIDPVSHFIFIDPTQLNQILINLCTNAFHAMEHSGGKLNISLKEVELLPEDLVHHPDIEATTFILLSVSDSGPGISPEIIDKIFDPFFTTKETDKGTGMGLSIIHGIITGNNGFITVESALNKGTVFNVFLPVVTKDVEHITKTVEHCPTGTERILFIDDEKILSHMGKAMLERLGYHVTIRNSSLDALETFQNQPGNFDVVITDQTMPGMTGANLARRMLQIRPDIPIILCTGFSSNISEEKAKSMGIKEFAFKPLAKKDMALLIRKVLG